MPWKKYSEQERAAIINHHPLFQALKFFITARMGCQQPQNQCKLIKQSTNPDSAQELECFNETKQCSVDQPDVVYEQIDCIIDTDMPTLVTDQPIEEPNELMENAVLSAIELTNNPQFNRIMSKAETEIDHMLDSVDSFCKDILESAKNDKEPNKENLSISSLAVAPTHKCTKTGKMKSKTALKTRKQARMPKKSSDILREWLIQHADNPYPTDDEKVELCLRTNLTMATLNQWFINSRRRVLNSLGLRVPRKC